MKTINTSDLLLAEWLKDTSPLSLEAFGAEQGFNERADVVIAADGTDLNDFWDEVQQTIAIRNAGRSSIIDSLTFRVTNVSETVQVPDDLDFEPASEYGQPVGFKGTATRIFRGYDFKFYDLAIRYTWMFIAEATGAQLQNNHNLALEASKKLVFMKVMQRLFNPLNGNGFSEKNEPVTVFSFFNGDGEIPIRYKQFTFDGSHNHYVTSGTASVTPKNVDDLAWLLEEHGYLINLGYKLVLWVSKQEADIIRTWRTTNGAPYDFVPNAEWSGGAIWVSNQGQYIGNPGGSKVEGEIGTYGPFHVVMEQYIPVGYMAAVATGGQNNLGNPIGLREHSNPAYQGLKVIPGNRSDYPLIDSFYRQGVGTGIRQRGGGAVMQITTGGTYQVPTAYDPANYI